MAENKAITALIGDGADAMSNMYEVYLKFPGKTDTGFKCMTVRATGFNIPEAEVTTYDVSYHGYKISKPKSDVTFDRKFSIEFRIDAAYALHEAFLQWQGFVGNPVTGGVANVAAALGEVEVVALSDFFIANGTDKGFPGDKKYVDDNGHILESGSIVGGKGTYVRKWSFRDVWVRKVGQPQFKTEGGDKMTFTVDFSFGQCDMPGYTPASTASAT